MQNTNERMVVPAQIVRPEEVQRNSDNYDKLYLLLLVFVDENDQETKDFLVKRGRKETYEYLKDLVINEKSFDIVLSKIFNQKTEIGQEINVGKFLRYMKDKFFIDDSFDVDDYFTRDCYISDEDDPLPIEE